MIKKMFFLFKISKKNPKKIRKKNSKKIEKKNFRKKLQLKKKIEKKIRKKIEKKKTKKKTGKKIRKKKTPKKKSKKTIEIHIFPSHDLFNDFSRGSAPDYLTSLWVFCRFSFVLLVLPLIQREPPCVNAPWA